MNQTNTTNLILYIYIHNVKFVNLIVNIKGKFTCGKKNVNMEP